MQRSTHASQIAFMRGVSSTTAATGRPKAYGAPHPQLPSLGDQIVSCGASGAKYLAQAHRQPRCCLAHLAQCTAGPPIRKKYLGFRARSDIARNDMPTLGIAFLAFLAFSACASSAYLLNDLFDLADDRQHPSKRYRAIASGDRRSHRRSLRFRQFGWWQPPPV